jgi:1-phosphofructokinase family hexose kinase
MSLGTSSTALGFAAGRSGEFLRDSLEGLGIQTEFIWVEGETRTNVSIVETEGEHYIKANEPGPTISIADQEKLMSQIREKATAGDWWVLAGSLPPGVPTFIYADIVAVIQSAGAKAILDTSGEGLKKGCDGRPFLIKPNDYEAGKLTGLPVETRPEIITAAQAIFDSGVENVVISLGKAGAMLVSEDKVSFAASPAIQEANPIGAGDSMVGGLVWALSQGRETADALRWGIACGAATASMQGTAVGSKELVDSLVNNIEIIRLDV